MKCDGQSTALLGLLLIFSTLINTNADMQFSQQLHRRLDTDMNQTTLLLQGKIEPDVLEFFTERYPHLKVVASTWLGSEILNVPDNGCVTSVIQSRMPKDDVRHITNQLVSTLHGLSVIDTEFVIKLRGDEYISNLERIADHFSSNPDVVYTSPVYFRRWEYLPFHISDHLIAGKTDNIRLMFKSVKDDLEMKWFDGVYAVPEQMLAMSYLRRKDEVQDLSKIDGRALMKQRFFILDYAKLVPYRVVAHMYNSTWESNFIPEANDSVASIEDY